MARLGNWSAQTGHASSEPGNNFIVGSPSVVAVSLQTNEDYSWLFDASNEAVSAGSGFFTATLGRWYYGRAVIRIDTAFPPDGVAVMNYQQGPSPFTLWASVRYRTGGFLQLAINGTNYRGSQVAISLGQTYVVELGLRINGAAATDQAIFRLDTVEQGNVDETIGDTAPDVLNVGWNGNISGTEQLRASGITLNDDTGAADNTWPGKFTVKALLPASDSARTGWTDNAGATTNLFQAVDTRPPIGEGPAGANFRNAAAAVFSAANVVTPTNLAPALPTRVNGDVLLCFAWSRSITATVATPSGWTLLSGFPKRSATASGGSLYVFARLVDGSETAPTVSWASLTTGNAGDASGAVILSYSGVDTSGGIANIMDGTVTLSDQAAATTTVTVPSITTAQTNSLAVGFALKLLESAATFTPPTNWAERVDAATTSGTGHFLEISDRAFAAAGATGAVTATPSVTTSSRALGVTLALKSTTPTAKSQIKDTQNNATDNYDAVMQDYTTAGIGLSDTIIGVRPLIVGGQEGGVAQTIGVAMVSNPAISEASTTTPAAAISTFPTGWRGLQGSHLAGDIASGSRGTGPVMRVGRRTASANAVHVAQMLLLVEYQPAVVTAVGISRALPYSMIAPVGVSRTQPYTVKQAVGASRILPYVAKTAVGTSRILPYVLKQRATVSRAQPYMIVAHVAISRVLPYVVRQTVATSRGQPYVVRAAVNISRVLPYTVRRAVTATRILPYTVVQHVALSRVMPYVVRQAVAASRSQPYIVRRAAGASRVLPYALSGYVGASRALPYKVIVHVGTSRILPSTIKQSVGSSRVLPYMIRQTATANRVLPYTVRANVVISRVLPATVKQRVGASRVLPYTALNGVTVSRTLPYVVRVGVGTSRVQPYTVRQTVGASRTLPYSVRTNIGTSRILLYALVEHVGTSRILRYAVIDTTPPVTDVTSGPDNTLVSPAVPLATFTWQADSAFAAYEIRVVPTASSLHSEGMLIGTTHGSVNMTGSAGNYPASTDIQSKIQWQDLEDASPGSGDKVIKVFTRDLSGNWSV